MDSVENINNIAEESQCSRCGGKFSSSFLVRDSDTKLVCFNCAHIDNEVLFSEGFNNFWEKIKTSEGLFFKELCKNKEVKKMNFVKFFLF